ncbi:MAG: hypothetical protein ABSA30_12260, partial [Candidatus Aminicenantales bacterium]
LSRLESVTYPGGRVVSYNYSTTAADGARVEKSEREGALIKITLAPDGDGPFTWSVKFPVRQERRTP